MISFNGKNLIVLLFIPFFVSAMSEGEMELYSKYEHEYKLADQELNVLYKKLIDEYKNDGAGIVGQEKSRDFYLKIAQREWIKMRDASCDYETYESKTGTGFSTIYEKCLLDKTKERIKYLKDK